jgi:hypothetical protein
MKHKINFLITAILISFGFTYGANAAYTWFEHEIAPAQGTVDDFIGYATAIDGQWAIVGAYGDECVYVFQKSGSTWIQTQRLVAPDATAGDGFGRSVAIYGNNIIIGAFHDADKGVNSGSAYIFTWNSTQLLWKYNTKLLASDGAGSDLFGQSVAISNEFAAVGADGEYSNRGAVYVYSISNWAENSIVYATTRTSNAHFGYSVSIDDNRGMLVGAYGEGAGAAYMCGYDGRWLTGQKLSGITSGDKFGYSVCIKGQKALVGAYNRSSATGAVYVFRHPSKIENWSLWQTITPANPATGQRFGYSVTFSGNYAVLGSPSDGFGSIYIYTASGNDWVDPLKFTASDGGASDEFGSSVGISGTSTIAGAIKGDGAVANSGSVYMFEYAEITSLTLLTPNGGEKIAGGSKYNITWGSVGTMPTVGLEYSINNGSSWVTIGSVPNTGVYEWTVADANSAQCRIRVSAAATSDVSNNVFRIYPCKLTYDLNNDCIVDLKDFADLTSEWLMCGDPADANCVE